MDRTDDSMMVDEAMNSRAENEGVSVTLRKLWFDDDQYLILLILSINEGSECSQVGMMAF